MAPGPLTTSVTTSVVGGRLAREVPGQRAVRSEPAARGVRGEGKTGHEDGRGVLHLRQEQIGHESRSTITRNDDDDNHVSGLLYMDWPGCGVG